MQTLPTLAEVRAERARRSLAQFVRQGWHVLEPETELVWNWHIDAVCKHLEAVSDGRIRQLIINIPPGHMKSLLVCVFWPAWQWLRRPAWRALFSSYAMDLSTRDSVRCRDLIESDWYRETFAPGWLLKEDANLKTNFATSAGGFRFSTSVGGKATGFRGNCVVVDDSLNVMDAVSKLKRDHANSWWSTAMSSRVNDPRKDARVIIGQRVHEDDTCGAMLAKGGWDHLYLPSLFVPERKCRTSIGWEDPRTERDELLFAEMYTREVLEQAKLDLGSYGFAAQHQQEPSPEEGGILKRAWWKRWTVLPATMDEVIQSWDMSFKDTDGTDYVVGQIWGRKGSDFYLLDQVRDRMGFSATVAAVLRLTERWPQSTLKLVEDKANGPAVIDTLKHRIPGLVAVEPQGSKIARCYAIQPLLEAGNVWIPMDAPWIDHYINETAVFPHGQFDDIVDSTTQALIRMSNQGWTKDRATLEYLASR